MTKLLKFSLFGNGYYVINPVRSKVKRLTTKGLRIKSVDRCLLTVDNRSLKRQQKIIFPIITLFTFAEQQPRWIV